MIKVEVLGGMYGTGFMSRCFVRVGKFSNVLQIAGVPRVGKFSNVLQIAGVPHLTSIS